MSLSGRNESSNGQGSSGRRTGAASGPTVSNGNLRDRKPINNYDASNPGKDDAVFYEGTWWRYVCGTGWVEQEFEQGTQRIRDKGLPVGPSSSTSVKGFGASVKLVKQPFEIRGWAGDRYSWGDSYGPNDNQKAVYKIDWSGVVAFWNTGENVWYAVKWNKKDQKFTKADNIAPEGIPLKPEHTARKWQDDIKVSNVEVDQEFYHSDTWWVKQNGQLVEQEWNERNNQFRPKNRGLRGPSGKLVVGRFDKEIPISKLSNYIDYDPYTGEFVYILEDRPYMDAETGIVYYHATNGVGQKWWWYANWDEGIGKFYASWSLSSGPTSGKVRQWIPSTGGPFDLDNAEENQIVWYYKSFWKKMHGIWVPHTWDGKNRKFVIRKETTLAEGALIAPVGDVVVLVFEKQSFTVKTVQDSGSKSKGAYKVEGGDNQGKVLWWDGKKWTVPMWTITGGFGAGSKREDPKGSFVSKLNFAKKLSKVKDDEELWYRGIVWTKKGNALVHYRLNNGQYGKSVVIKAPIGDRVSLQKWVKVNGVDDVADYDDGVEEEEDDDDDEDDEDVVHEEDEVDEETVLKKLQIEGEGLIEPLSKGLIETTHSLDELRGPVSDREANRFAPKIISSVPYRAGPSRPVDRPLTYNSTSHSPGKPRFESSVENYDRSHSSNMTESSLTSSTTFEPLGENQDIGTYFDSQLGEPSSDDEGTSKNAKIAGGVVTTAATIGTGVGVTYYMFPQLFLPFISALI